MPYLPPHASIWWQTWPGYMPIPEGWEYFQLLFIWRDSAALPPPPPFFNIHAILLDGALLIQSDSKDGHYFWDYGVN